MNNGITFNSFTKTGLKFCQHQNRPNSKPEHNQKNGKKYCTETVKTIAVSDAVVKNKQYRTGKDFNLLPNKMTTSTLCSVFTNGNYTKSPMKPSSAHKVTHHRKGANSASHLMNKRPQCIIDPNEKSIQTERGEGLITLDQNSNLKDSIDKKTNDKQLSAIFIEDNNKGSDDDHDEQEKETKTATKLKAHKKPNTINNSDKDKDITHVCSYSYNNNLMTQKTQDFFYPNESKPSPISNNQKKQMTNQLYSSQNTFKASSDDPFLSTSNTFLTDYIVKYGDIKNKNEDVDYSNNDATISSKPCNYCGKSNCNINHNKTLYFNKPTKTNYSSMQSSYTKLDPMTNSINRVNRNVYHESYDKKDYNTVMPLEENISSKSKNNYTTLKLNKNQLNSYLMNPTKDLYDRQPIPYSEDKYNHLHYNTNGNPIINCNDDDNSNPVFENTISNPYKVNKERDRDKDRDRDRNESLEMKTKKVLFKTTEPFIIKHRSIIPDKFNNTKYIPKRDINPHNQISNSQSYYNDNINNDIPIENYFINYNPSSQHQNNRHSVDNNRSKVFNPEMDAGINDKLNHKRASSYMFNYDYSIYNMPVDYSKPLALNKYKNLELSPTHTPYYTKLEAKSKSNNNNFRSLSHQNSFAYRRNDYFNNNQRIAQRVYNNDSKARLTYELNSEESIDITNQNNKKDSNTINEKKPNASRINYKTIKINKISIPSIIKYRKPNTINKWKN